MSTKPFTTWQNEILKLFTPKNNHSQMILAIDPDDLMQDDSLLALLLAQNYDILPLGDEVEFRHDFEREYRQHWDQGSRRHLIVIVQAPSGANHIPYDIYEKSERIHLSVSELFPRLNAIVARELDNSYYLDLYPAHKTNLLPHAVGPRPERLNERETIEFILRSVFGLDPVAVGSVQLIGLLIKKHYSRRALPSALETYLIDHVLPRGKALGLTSEHVRDANAFYAWLAEQWATYVQAIFAGLKPNLDFDQAELRLPIDNLFTDGYLSRIAPPGGQSVSALPVAQQWIAIGLQLPQYGPLGGGQAVKESAAQALFSLHARLDALQAIDPAGYTLRDWLDTAAQWAEVIYAANNLPQPDYESARGAFFATRQQLDEAFRLFVEAKYSSISYYDDTQGPISLVKVNHWLQQEHSARERVALVCFDGLALDQWLLLRSYLQTHFPNLTFHENRTFAIAPTITPVSRQALFAGELPRAFAASAYQTSKDSDRWARFWVNYEIPLTRIAYLHAQANGSGLNEVHTITDGNNRRLGLVVNLFDDVMHGTKGSTAEADKRVYYQTLTAHLENGRLHELFSILFKQDYHVYLTSDHGNCAGVGTSIQPPKALVEKYAKRVALFDSAALAEDFATAHGLFYYRTKFSPESMHPVYLSGRDLLGTHGNAEISHGGLSLEEMVVPLVKLEQS
ncbi:MAG: BREX-3 system phosphatase PglZ [Anaerolineales bacterium]|nr:BREX-3 system phosphatase PglZ [Anaerolineales bacterium]